MKRAKAKSVPMFVYGPTFVGTELFSPNPAPTSPSSRGVAKLSSAIVGATSFSTLWAGPTPAACSGGIDDTFLAVRQDCRHIDFQDDRISDNEATG